MNINNQNIFLRRDEKEEKIRKLMIDELNNHVKIINEIYRNYPKNITTIGIA